MGEYYNPSMADVGSSKEEHTSGGWSETLRSFGVEAKKMAEKTKHSILQKMGKVESTKNAELDAMLGIYARMGAALDKIRRDSQSAMDSLHAFCTAQTNFLNSLEAGIHLVDSQEKPESDNLETISTLVLGGQATLVNGILYEIQKLFRTRIFNLLDDEKLREKDVQSRLETRKKIAADCDRYRSRIQSDSGPSEETIRKLQNKKQELDAITRGLEDSLESAIPRRRALIGQITAEYVEITQRFYREAARIFDQVVDGVSAERLTALKVSVSAEGLRRSTSRYSNENWSGTNANSTRVDSTSNLEEKTSSGRDTSLDSSGNRRRPPSPPLVVSDTGRPLNRGVREDSSSSSTEEVDFVGMNSSENDESQNKAFTESSTRKADFYEGEVNTEGKHASASSGARLTDDIEKTSSNLSKDNFSDTVDKNIFSRVRSTSFQADSPIKDKEESLVDTEEEESKSVDSSSSPVSRSRSFDDLIGEFGREKVPEAEGDLLGDFENADGTESKESKKPNPFDDDFLFSDAGGFTSGQSTNQMNSPRAEFAAQTTSTDKNSDTATTSRKPSAAASTTDSEEALRARLEPHVNAKINQWTLNGTRKTNLRLLLSTLHTVLWSGARWKPVEFQTLSNPEKVKAVYKKAILILHPDKFQQSGYTVEQQMIAERCFAILRESHDYFEAELKGKPMPNQQPQNYGANAYQPGMHRPGGGYPGPPPPPPPYPGSGGNFYNAGGMPYGGMPPPGYGMHAPPPGAAGAPPPPPYGWDPRMGQRRYNPPY